MEYAEVANENTPASVQVETAPIPAPATPLKIAQDAPPSPPVGPAPGISPLPKEPNKLLPIILIIVAVIVLLGGVVLFLWQRNRALNTKNVEEEAVYTEEPLPMVSPDVAPAPPVLPVGEPAQKEPDVKEDAALIRDALAKKHSAGVLDVSLGVKEITAEYAAGSVKFAGEDGGGWWLAAKVNGEWVLVADGNGVVMCADVKPYSFPISMVAECYDSATDSLQQL